VNQVADAHHAWRAAADRLAELEGNSDAINARRDLVSFQLEELARLDLRDDEIAELEQEQRLLASTDVILATAQQVLALCDGGGDTGLDVCTGLGRAAQQLDALADKMPALREAQSLFDSARIQVEEAVRELQHHVDRLELDPARLQWVEDRLGAAHQLARKHRISAAELIPLRQRLATELDVLGDAESLDALTATVAELLATYLKDARQLAAARAEAALRFCDAVNEQLTKLAMAGATIDIAATPLDEARYSANGIESIEILIRTNPGQPHRPLARVASGGELSRVSLAIQVVAARHSTIPTLVFDEVDVGIGGATASVVGQLLRQLGESGQVICVTHLPQVASAAHHHFAVSKSQDSDSATTDLRALANKDRIDEIARMLGGLSTSKQTLAHAREMLTLAANP
jgi:DNA repair protein RecN (Recombination protein N)